MFWFKSSGSLLTWLIRTLYVCVVWGSCRSVVVRREWLCAGRFYSLCVSSFSLFPPPRHCVLHQPPSIPQSFEKVGALFSLLLLLLCFRKRHLLKQQEPKKKKRGGKKISFKSETFKPCVQKWGEQSCCEDDEAVRPCSRVPWLHCEALCAEPLVLPSLPDQCFLHGMILLSWRPKNWKIKKRQCLHGRSERERERSTACMGVDWQTDTGAWRNVCSPLMICSDCDIIELAALSCIAAVLFWGFLPFCFVCLFGCFFYLFVPSPMSSHLLQLLHWLGMLHSLKSFYMPLFVPKFYVWLVSTSWFFGAKFITWTQDVQGNKPNSSAAYLKLLQE